MKRWRKNVIVKKQNNIFFFLSLMDKTYLIWTMRNCLVVSSVVLSFFFHLQCCRLCGSKVGIGRREFPSSTSTNQKSKAKLERANRWRETFVQLHLCSVCVNLNSDSNVMGCFVFVMAINTWCGASFDITCTFLHCISHIQLPIFHYVLLWIAYMDFFYELIWIFFLYIAQGMYWFHILGKKPIQNF